MKATLVAIILTFLVAAAPASAHPVLGTGSGPLAVPEGMGYAFSRLNTAPEILRRCRIGQQAMYDVFYNVLETECAQIKYLYAIVADPSANWNINWWDEIQRLTILEYAKENLLTAIAVKQAYNADFEGASQTANLLDHEDSIPVLTAIAVVAAERRFFLRSSDLVEEAYRRCHAAELCGRDDEGDWIDDTSGQSDIQWAAARIAIIQAENGNSSGALKTIRLWDELVGVDLDLRDRAYRAIALEVARQGKLLTSAEFLARIEKKKLRDEVEFEVKEIFAESNDT